MQTFREAVEEHGLERIHAVGGLFADDVVFRSPVSRPTYHGKDTLSAILLAVSRIFEDFRYVKEIGAAGDADHAFLFAARIGDVELEGCDFVHLDEHGLIDEFTVMVRPFRAAKALADVIGGQYVAARAELGLPPG
jgi:hypothetical protein